MTEIDGNGFWVRTEVSAAGEYLATYTPDGIHYPLTDWLGTKRKQVNPNLGMNNGVEETCTSFPFGDQFYCGSTLDASPRHFTGKERDAESGNDYFGARYYASSAGRWMSPDWSAQVTPIPYAHLGSPQSLNLYQYVQNSPIRNIDADGHIGLDGGYVDALTGLLGSEEANETQEEQDAENRNEAQRSASSSSKLGFWHRLAQHFRTIDQHFGNLIRLHGWNYGMPTIDEEEEDVVLATTGATDSAAVVTGVADLPKTGGVVSILSLANDHGPQNVVANAAGFVPRAGPFAGILAFDVDLIQWQVKTALEGVLGGVPGHTMGGPNGTTVVDPAEMNANEQCQAMGGCQP